MLLLISHWQCFCSVCSLGEFKEKYWNQNQKVSRESYSKWPWSCSWRFVEASCPAIRPRGDSEQRDLGIQQGPCHFNWESPCHPENPVTHPSGHCKWTTASSRGTWTVVLRSTLLHVKRPVSRGCNFSKIISNYKISHQMCLKKKANVDWSFCPTPHWVPF